MTQVVFRYSHYVEADFTPIRIAIIENDQFVACYRNYEPGDLRGQRYANQSEQFFLPDAETARRFVEGAGCYFVMQDEEIEKVIW